MKIGFAPYLSPEINKHLRVFNLFEADLNDYFNNTNYGDGILELYIGIVCISFQFEQFFKPRKPKYTFENKTYNKENVTYSIGRTFEYDIKLDFDTFKNATETECQKLLAEEILKSLNVLDDMKGKIKDFNKEKFKENLESYFKEKEFI